jgi:predicted phage terminase large subunit-like protein
MNKTLLKQIQSLPSSQKKEFIDLIEEYEKSESRKKCNDNFMPFVTEMWAAFIHGKHHEIMAEAFERVANGELKRLIINMPPRHTKSEFASYLLPAYSPLFGRKVRNLVNSRDFKEIFPDVSLQADSKAAGRWNTNKGGEYFAIGVGGAVTGKGADLLVIDDPHSEQEGASADINVFNKAYEWYTSGPRQRLQPNGAIVVVMTRWHDKDLTGQVVDASIKRGGADQWEVIELPAILPSGSPLWSQFWSLEELNALRAELPNSKWMAQYQQDPTSEEGALVKREWWKTWEGVKPPKCEFIIQSWDTAFMKNQRADYSACTTWGVFYVENQIEGKFAPNLILLDAYKERLEFPELKVRAMEKYKQYQPEAFIVEAKAAGMPLIFELRQMGIPVQEYTPSRGNDKISRVNAVSDLFASGVIWAPETRWAEEVINEFAGFPNMQHDDLVDSSTQALLRYRQGGFISVHSDEEDEPLEHNRIANYY